MSLLPLAIALLLPTVVLADQTAPMDHSKMDQSAMMAMMSGAPEGVTEGGPPVSGKLSAALLFLYFSGGRDRTMIWDIHWNVR